MIDPELLAILVCPDTHQPLRQAGDELVARVNRALAEGRVQNVAGQAVAEALDEGLVREDGRVLYPVRDGIPVLLVEEGLPLEGL